MSNKQQTAVEWLFETVCNNDWKHLPGEIKLQIFEQAKEMEKEQTKNRSVESYYLYTQYLDQLPKVGGATVEMDFEQYYNETYGGN